MDDGHFPLVHPPTDETDYTNVTNPNVGFLQSGVRAATQDGWSGKTTLSFRDRWAPPKQKRRRATASREATGGRRATVSIREQSELPRQGLLMKPIRRQCVFDCAISTSLSFVNIDLPLPFLPAFRKKARIRISSYRLHAIFIHLSNSGHCQNRFSDSIKYPKGRCKPAQ